MAFNNQYVPYYSLRLITVIFVTFSFNRMLANEKILQDSIPVQREGTGSCRAALKLHSAEEAPTQPMGTVAQLTRSLRHKGIFLEKMTRSLMRIYSHQSMGAFMRNNKKYLERADISASKIMLHFRQTNGVFPGSTEMLLKLSQYIRIRILKGSQLGEGIRFIPQIKISSRDISIAELSLTLMEIYLTQIQLHGLSLELGRNPLAIDLIGFAMGRGQDKLESFRESFEENFLKRRIEAAEKKSYQVITDQAPRELLGKTSKSFRERLLFASLWASELRHFVDLRSQLEDIVATSVLSLYLTADMEFRQVLSNLMSWYQSDFADQDSVKAMLAYFDFSRAFGMISPDNQAIILKLQEEGSLPQRPSANEPFPQVPAYEMMDLGMGNQGRGSNYFDDSLEF
ncbi:MAG: hypothetical protein IPJ71_13855 [Bdellovibrionales bacterium]|nr:hypothetical protein [Bdellovibrionales bacterium]